MKTITTGFPLILESFIQSASRIPASLITAVVEQSGGWEEFTEHAADVVNHGAAGGFSGFTYYTDTVPFTAQNLDAIRKMAREQADDMDTSTFEMVAGFKCFADVDPDQLGTVFYGFQTADMLFANDESTTIANGLAWYALEEVSRAWHELALDNLGDD